MKAPIKLPFIAWRDGRPRFVPGARERALGFKGWDLKHTDGRWFTLAEAEVFAAERHAAIKEMRGRHAPTQVPAATQEKAGFVYFLRCAEWLKIGYSNSPSRRMREIVTRSPYAVTSMAAVRGSRHDEKLIHQALANHRINGEWFSYSAPAAEIMIRSTTFGRVMLDKNVNNVSRS
jgi:hypothetical protein